MQLVPVPSATVRVSTVQVRGLTEAVAATGASVDEFLARYRLAPARLDDAQGWFTLEEFDALMLAAAEFTDDPAFGMHWAERSPMMQFDLMPALVTSASTLREALDALLACQPIVSSRPECALHEHRDRAVLEIDVLALSARGRQVRSELVLTGFQRLLRYKGVYESLRRVSFVHARPAYGEEYDRVFGERACFGQPRYSIEFSRAALARRNVHRNAELHAMLLDRSAALRRRALGRMSHGEQVEQHLRAALPRLLSAAEAAQALAMSERSLRRRLSDEQTSYGELVERVQRRRGEELIESGKLSVKEIAHELGFHSLSGFHRAFRRWTGSTPGRQRGLRPRD